MTATTRPLLPRKRSKLTGAQKLELNNPLGSPIERTFDMLFKACCPGLPEPQKQLQFDPSRGWRFDRAWYCGELPMVAVELDGKVHLNEDKWRRDIEKMNRAQQLGWIVLHCTSRMLDENPTAFFEMLREVLEK